MARTKKTEIKEKEAETALKHEAKEEKASLTGKDIEKLVVDLAKQGVTSEKIGLILRDKHGVKKAKFHGKKISQILKENDLKTDADLINLQKKVETLKKHIIKNKHDYRTKRILIINEARLTKFKKYRKLPVK
jgi:small subunit ribosomal protein S15